jgi:murein DD-endopeptidase MepM/ murein hydrolase activator NlpD
MPSVFSEAFPGPIVRPLALLVALALPFAEGPAARASSWALGVFPVPAFAGFTSGFGDRIHPLAGDLRPHYGVDIAAPLGSPVRSWWSGRVQEVISDAGCGNGLVIRSGEYEHIYCHLAGRSDGRIYSSGRVRLLVGQVVRRGEQIGHVGLTGSTTGPHLHWGLRFRGQWLDPARILRAMATSRRQIVARGAAPNVGAFR